MSKVRIRKRGSTFSYIFEMAKIDGKRKVCEKGGFNTEQDAYIAGIKAMNEYNDGGMVFRPSEISLADFMDFWLDNQVKLNLKNNTQANHTKMIKCHIRPDLGGYKLKALNPAIVQEWVNTKIKKYAWNTIDNMLKVLNSSLAYAVHPAGLIKSNPAQYVKVPKAAKRMALERKIMSQDDVNKLLVRFPFNTPYHMPILIGYYTGCRISEALGLTWDDIDFKNNTITITHTLQRILGDGGIWYHETPKTHSSKRTILIGSTLLKILKNWKKQQAENEMKYGGNYKQVYRVKEYNEKINKEILSIKTFPKKLPFDLGEMIYFICTQENGEFVKQTAFAHATKIARTMGIPFDFHSLRHTHATTLIENGANIKDVSERLGHSSIDVTMDVYTHNTEIMKKETVDIFERVSKIK